MQNENIRIFHMKSMNASKMHEILQKDPVIWDLFSRKEETGSSFRDQFERFPFYASSNRDIFKPHVSKYLIENGYHVEYPEEKPFAVCLTHDIDQIYTSILEKENSANTHLIQGSLSGFMHSLWQMRSKKVPLWNFNDIFALEERYEAKSSFYFMAENEGEVDYLYPIEDCISVLGDIIDHGNEVGLHGGHTTYLRPEEMKSKKQRMEKLMNKKIIGYRNHFLRFKVPETWEYLREAGFLYDVTFGYADCVGFRNGMCHPFKPFNLNNGKTIEILEIPLTIMDVTFIHYMRLDIKKSWEITKRLIDTVMQYNGVLTVLWHNTYLMGDQLKFYEKILSYCAEKNAWMTSGEEIARWVNYGD
jgi:peptidoglycan/xylan/chitin deacetylase (PgdA/CDA1 family)